MWRGRGQSTPACNTASHTCPCILFLWCSLLPVFIKQLCLERKAGERTSQNLSPNPRDTHIVGFSDQPLFIVQNMADAAHQLHGAAVVCVLKESNSGCQRPPSAPTMPTAVPSIPSSLPAYASASTRKPQELPPEPLSLLDLISPPRSSYSVRSALETHRLQSTSNLPSPLTCAS